MIKTPVTSCPTCRKVIDAATGITTQQLSPGCLSVCTGCGTLLQYDDSLNLKTLNDKQLQAIKIAAPPTYDLLVNLSNYFKHQQALKN
jgi:hypothetical protein